MSANGGDVEVFKHREVKSLIKSRILSLENSVASNDVTIPEPKPAASVPPVPLPSSTIRELAASMHSAPAVEIEKPTPIVNNVPQASAQKPYSYIPIPPKTMPPKPKPVLEKQYSFTMDTKFHEEKVDDDNWLKVESLPSMSESEATDSEEEYDSESSAYSEDVAVLNTNSPKSSNMSILRKPKHQEKVFVSSGVQTDPVSELQSDTQEDDAVWNKET